MKLMTNKRKVTSCYIRYIITRTFYSRYFVTNHWHKHDMEVIWMSRGMALLLSCSVHWARLKKNEACRKALKF